MTVQTLAAPWGLRLWRVDLRVPASAEQLRTLSSDEVARAARFVFPRDRRRFEAAHCALRFLLAQELGTDAAALAFDAGAQGKPVLTGAGGPAFNLSHSGDVALLALATDASVAAIGVDVEIDDEQRHSDALAARVFTPAELAQYRATAPQERGRAFLRGWTRKEACLKAAGTGLSLAPASFDAGLDADMRRVELRWREQVWALRVVSVDAGPGVIAALARIDQGALAAALA